jgi:hypothetical protein
MVEYSTNSPGKYLFTYNKMGIYIQEAEIGIQTDDGSKIFMNIAQMPSADQP